MNKCVREGVSGVSRLFILRVLMCVNVLLLSACKSDKLSYKGYIEADYQYISPTTSGTLKAISVRRGDFVRKRTTIFALDDVELKAVLESAKASVRQVQAVLKEEANEYQRAQVLLKSNNISQADFEKRESGYKTTIAKLDAAKQSLLAAEERLKDSAPMSENDAYVEDVFFSLGEFVPAGRAVVSLLAPDNIKVRFFVPQSNLSTVTVGGNILVLCDGCHSPKKAKITYISRRAEYTPPVIYSTESRQKMVFMVEAKLELDEPLLHPGIPVDVEVQ